MRVPTLRFAQASAESSEVRDGVRSVKDSVARSSPTTARFAAPDTPRTIVRGEERKHAKVQPGGDCGETERLEVWSSSKKVERTVFRVEICIKVLESNEIARVRRDPVR